MGGCCSQEEPDEDRDEGHDEEDGSRRKKPKRAFTRDNVCCTDILFLIIFLLFVGLMVYIAVLCIIYGDARRLVFGYDSFGNTCDQDNSFNPIPNVTYSGSNLQGLTNVFFLNIFDPFDSMQLCVSKCPEMDLITPDDVHKFAEETGSRLCLYDLPLQEYRNSRNYDSSGKGPCPRLPIFRSVSLLQRCAPDPYALIKDDDDDTKSGSSMDDDRQNATDTFFAIYELDNAFRKVLSDLYTSWREMIVLCVISVVVSFIVVLMIRFLAAIIVWLIVILAALGSLVGTGFLWWTYARIRNNLDRMDFWHVPLLGISISNEKAFLAFSITATVLTVILLLILLVLRKRIALAIALFKEAGKCVIDLPSLLFQPVWTFIILLVFFAYWLVVLAFIGTSGKPYPRDKDELGFESVVYVQQGFASHFWWIHLIGLIWISEVILASQQFVISGAVAMWFFTRNKKQLGCPCASAISSLILHHLGSIAFGSFIIVLVKLPRYILMYISSKLEGKTNACAKCCAKCCICCLWCLEKLLKFINKNAYTIIAMKGVGFCPAAKKALSILTNNALRVAAINGVGGFVLNLAKIGITATTCAIGVLWLRRNNDLHFYAIPVFLTGLFAFLCAHCALTVYDMVVDALLLCFCEDSSIAESNSSYEVYMSDSLKDYVDHASRELDSNPGSREEIRAEGDKEMSPLSSEPNVV